LDESFGGILPSNRAHAVKADSCGLTLDEYRLAKALPAGWVDWAKLRVK